LNIRKIAGGKNTTEIENVRNTGGDISSSFNSRLHIRERTILTSWFSRFQHMELKISRFHFENSWIHDFIFTNSTLQIHVSNCTNLDWWIHDFSFVNSRFQLLEFRISTCKNSCSDFTISTPRIQDFIFTKFKSRIREVEILSSWIWNREFVNSIEICQFMKL
jgi:hypothetical protein